MVRGRRGRGMWDPCLRKAKTRVSQAPQAPGPGTFSQPANNLKHSNMTKSALIKVLSCAQCYGAEIISFGSSSSPAPRLRINFVRYLDNYLFWLEYQYFLHGFMHVEVPKKDYNCDNLQKLLKQPWLFSIKFLQVFDKKNGAGVAIRNFGSGSRSQFNFGSSAPAPQHRLYHEQKWP